MTIADQPGAPTTSRCLLCGTVLDDSCSTMIKERHGRSTLLRVGFQCPGCGAANTAEHSSHLALVEER